MPERYGRIKGYKEMCWPGLCTGRHRLAARAIERAACVVWPSLLHWQAPRGYGWPTRWRGEGLAAQARAQDARAHARVLAPFTKVVIIRARRVCRLARGAQYTGWWRICGWALLTHGLPSKGHESTFLI